MKGIYVYTNENNGMQYVGKSTNLERRVLQHIEKNAQGLLAEAIKSCGLSNFTIRLYPYPDVSGKELASIEKAEILRLDTLVPNGYNQQLPEPEKEDRIITRGKNAGKYVSETLCQSCKKRLKTGEEGMCWECDAKLWEHSVKCDMCDDYEVHVNDIIKGSIDPSGNFCSEECMWEFETQKYSYGL